MAPKAAPKAQVEEAAKAAPMVAHQASSEAAKAASMHAHKEAAAMAPIEAPGPPLDAADHEAAPMQGAWTTPGAPTEVPGLQADEAPCWKLPLPLLGRVLRSGCAPPDPSEGKAYLSDSDRAELHKLFCTCKGFAKALLSSTSTVYLDVQLPARTKGRKPKHALVSVLRWAEPCCADLYLDLITASEKRPASIKRLMDLLHEEGVILRNVTKLTCYTIKLDCQAPASLAAVMPNVKYLNLRECTLSFEPGLVLEGCSQLSELHVWGYEPVDQTAWLPQLQHLSQLPSLSCLYLNVHYPTSFLPSLAGQLTTLYLEEGEPDQDRWEAGLAAAGQCTNLRELRLLSSCTPQQLGTFTRLTHLEDLSISDPMPGEECDPDDLLRALLQLTGLTQMRLTQLRRLKQSYADSPCGWRKLSLYESDVQVLARLPLHSLTRPIQVQLRALRLDQPDLSVADVQAAADNLARSGQQPGMVYTDDFHEDTFTIKFASGQPTTSSIFQAAILSAAAPFVPQDMTKLKLHHAELDALLVTALKAVVPAAQLTRITFIACTIQPSVWVQLALSFPNLIKIKFEAPINSRPPAAEEVMGYFKTVCSRNAANARTSAVAAGAATTAAGAASGRTVAAMACAATTAAGSGRTGAATAGAATTGAGAASGRTGAAAAGAATTGAGAAGGRTGTATSQSGAAAAAGGGAGTAGGQQAVGSVAPAAASIRFDVKKQQQAVWEAGLRGVQAGVQGLGLQALVAVQRHW